jgi:hypothetical protein
LDPEWDQNRVGKILDPATTRSGSDRIWIPNTVNSIAEESALHGGFSQFDSYSKPVGIFRPFNEFYCKLMHYRRALVS